jgi:polysaccharide export outer membrane protein
MEKCRRTGVAALVLMTLSCILTGCLSSNRYKKEGDGSSAYSRLPPAAAALTSSSPPASDLSLAPGVTVAPGEIQPAGYFPGGSGDKERVPEVGGPAHPLMGIAPPLQSCPNEIFKTSHPPYTVSPPDILIIDAVRLIPRPPYRIEPLEILLINVNGTLATQPISGPFVVSPEGAVNLGFSYGSVPVAGLTLAQAQAAIKTHLGSVLKMPEVTIGLAQFRGMQQVRGQHLVRPDGTISLGTYGAVYVAGMTIGQVKCVVEKHLSEYLLNPVVSVDVAAYNSKFFYVILDGANNGQQVVRVPITGNETVLDAISLIQGIAPVSSKKRMWLARPAPANAGCSQILPIDWQAITMAGQTLTNYQLFPGDRIYVDSYPLSKFDNNLARVLAPVERILGITLLGASTVNAFQNNRGGNNGSGTGLVVIP